MRIWTLIFVLTGLLLGSRTVRSADDSPFGEVDSRNSIRHTSAVGDDKKNNHVLLKSLGPTDRPSKPELVSLEAAAEPASKHELTGKLKPPSHRKSTSTSSPRSSSTTATGQWMTTILGLTIVLGLILSVAYAFRKHIPLSTKILPPDVIEVLGRRFIDQRNCVQLIRCGNRILIVAHSPTHGLQTLGEITDPVEIDSLAGRCKQSDSTSTTSRFEELVAGQFRTKRDKTATDSGPSLEAEHLPESGLRLPRSPLGGSLRREIPHA